MNESTYLQYRKAYRRAVDFMLKYYAEHKEKDTRIL